jgi:uridine kinase
VQAAGCLVLLLAGASGSGKSTLVTRLHARHADLAVVQLDDFYREGGDPGLPAWGGIVDWDDPGSWDADAAHAALLALCVTGRCEVPVYDIPTSRRTGTRPVEVGRGGLVVAEGLFAPELVARLRSSGLLLDAVHLRSRPPVTFVRRLARDLAGHRKPPLTLLRRGLALARRSPRCCDGGPPRAPARSARPRSRHWWPRTWHGTPASLAGRLPAGFPSTA